MLLTLHSMAFVLCTTFLFSMVVVFPRSKLFSAAFHGSGFGKDFLKKDTDRKSRDKDIKKIRCTFVP